MRIFKKKSELIKHLGIVRESGGSIGFVPTMGALHIGHVSLISEAKKENDFVVCSIFVNPNQFNDKTDLQNYPRTELSDCELLKANNCDAVFIPEVSEIYPEQDSRQFDFGELDKILEGKSRPGHFNGVAQVVSKLFEIVNPERAYFGLKDYQQVMVIKALVRNLNLKVKIVPCEIFRERDGLAFSSRNTLLNSDERMIAAHVPALLVKAKQLIEEFSVERVSELIREEASQLPLKLDYFEICEAETLKKAENSSPKPLIALIAVFVGRIRLIDNVMLK